jgi:hypothetical protein
MGRAIAPAWWRAVQGRKPGRRSGIAGWRLSLGLSAGRACAVEFGRRPVRGGVWTDARDSVGGRGRRPRCRIHRGGSRWRSESGRGAEEDVQVGWSAGLVGG